MNPENRVHRVLRYVGRGLAVVGVIAAPIFISAPGEATGHVAGAEGQVHCATAIYNPVTGSFEGWSSGPYRGTSTGTLVYFGVPPNPLPDPSNSRVAVQRCNLPTGAGNDKPVTTIAYGAQGVADDGWSTSTRAISD